MVLEQPSDGTRRAFEAWRAQDPLHHDAYSRYQRLWSDAAALKDMAEPADERSEDHAPVFRALRWPLRPALLMAASLAAIGFVAWQFHGRASQDFSTAIAQTREVTLADGSKVALGPKSSIQVWIDRSERHVALTAGEAFFDVAHDAAKPFLIDIGPEQVRVIGTKFDIRRGDSSVQVSVLEGIVRVRSAPIADPAAASHTLHAGEQLDVDSISGTVRSLGPIGSADPFAWRKGRLVYVDAPLREVIADANRYSSRSYVIRDETLANKRVSLAYSAEHVTQMMDGLAEAIPFKLNQISVQQVEIDADDPARR